jgi:predicted dehydrogenase
MTPLSSLSRRRFIGGAARLGAVGVAAPNLLLKKGWGASGPGANGRIQLGLIGCGQQGRLVLGRAARHPAAVVTAACDVFPSRREAIAKRHQDTCRLYADFRDLLARPEVDAVIIASPPHWHALMAIMAMEAGKDVYLEKPMTLHLGEDIALRNAVRRTGRVCQVGTQMHATENYRRAVETVRAGYLGSIGTVRSFHVLNRGRAGVGRQDPTTRPPVGLDWDLWCGPGPLTPFNAILSNGSGNGNSWIAYSGGWTAGMGPHILDLPVWALDLPYPTEISASGGRFIVEDDGDAYDNHEVLWRYPKLTMTWMSSLTNSYGFDLHGRPVPQRRQGTYFHGTRGTMWSDYHANRIVPEGDAMNDSIKPEITAVRQARDFPHRALYSAADLHPVRDPIPPSPGHEFEWMECIKTRQQPSCTPDYHSRINVPLALSVLSLRLGRSLRFDPATQQIVGDPEASRLSVPEYRAPWKFPTTYLRA